MATTPFEPGDIVVLKSGSPRMTVAYSDKQSTTAYFFNYDTNQVSIAGIQEVPTAILILASKE